jgi:hypothetical protein
MVKGWTALRTVMFSRKCCSGSRFRVVCGPLVLAVRLQSGPWGAAADAGSLSLVIGSESTSKLRFSCGPIALGR